MYIIYMLLLYCLRVCGLSAFQCSRCLVSENCSLCLCITWRSLHEINRAYFSPKVLYMDTMRGLT